MKLIQDNGMPIYGRLAKAPIEFNILDYQNQFLKARLKRKIRYKKFSFIGIQHQNYALGLAIADLAWVGHGFYYAYQRDTHQYLDYHGLQPFALHTQVQEYTSKGQFNYFKHQNIEIYSKDTIKYRKVDIRRNDDILAEFKILKKPEQQGLYLCSPTGIRGWTFTHKSMCLPVQGYFNFNDEKIEFDQSTHASLDDSCGFLRPETEWFWLSCQTYIDGHHIGINLASGVNESVGNENCLWIDQQLMALNDVIFNPIHDHIWHIYSIDGQIDLRVKTGWSRAEQINAGFVASEFNQWLAEIKGKIGTSERHIEIDHAHALFEQHYAKW